MQGVPLKDRLAAGTAVLLMLARAGVAHTQTQEQAPLPTRPLETQQAHESAPAPSERTLELPLWELGLGLGAVSFRDYRGSDTTHAYPVPVPYFIYRGKFLQADRSGLKSKLLHQDRVELNVSLNATTPVRHAHGA